MDQVPILKMGDFLIVSIQQEMHDLLARNLQDDLSERVHALSPRGVLIDISAVQIVDSFIGRMIANIAGITGIMDAQTVITGMQPPVAITLVEMGITLPGVLTALTIEDGMRILRDLGQGVSEDSGD